mgnify:CR=1 FL=1|tara:strand:+ start:1193 stop:2272 length:1080 start_codon:yes stop_codon:yes gene_type:complete
MVDQKKQISINPAFFKLGGKYKKTQKKHKIKPKIPPNTIKRKLLERIKEHQKEKQILHKKGENITDSNEFDDEFDSSLAYLHQLIKKNKEKKEKKRETHRLEQGKINEINNNTKYNENLTNKSSLLNKTIKNNLKFGSDYNDNYTITDTIPYGNLKGGKKQTYKQYINNTNKVPNSLTIEDKDINKELSTNIVERKSRLQEIQNKFLNNHKPQFNENPTHLINPNISGKLHKNKLNERVEPNNILIKKNGYKGTRKGGRSIRRRKIKTRRKLGKVGNKIGVLVKNNKTRKAIEEEHDLLKTSSMTEVKAYLRSHGLLKIGSPAPHEMLRKLYEDSFMSGDVYNKSSNILIHNYLHQENE